MNRIIEEMIKLALSNWLVEIDDLMIESFASIYLKHKDMYAIKIVDGGQYERLDEELYDKDDYTILSVDTIKKLKMMNQIFKIERDSEGNECLVVTHSFAQEFLCIKDNI